MLVDPTLTSQKTTHAASTHSAARATAANASLFSTALAKASTKATTSSDSSSAQNVSTSTKVPKGEKSEHVKGHSYDEVTAGPRDGMFVNRSGNKRDGQAFARVLRDGREFHIYGTGKHRLIVEVKGKDNDAASGTTNTPDTSNQVSDTSGSSGGATTAPATDTTGAPAG
jgi:hypothetical protein